MTNPGNPPDNPIAKCAFPCAACHRTAATVVFVPKFPDSITIPENRLPEILEE